MTERKQAPQVAVPRIDVDARLEEANVYASVFGNGPSVSGRTFLRPQSSSGDRRCRVPGLSTAGSQSQLHGHYGRHSIMEAASFYQFVCDQNLAGRRRLGRVRLSSGFRCWLGQNHPPVHARFPAEEHRWLRTFKPVLFGREGEQSFISFLSGGYLPTGILPAERFDLVVGWSVFSHLSPKSAAAWLAELQR